MYKREKSTWEILRSIRFVNFLRKETWKENSKNKTISSCWFAKKIIEYLFVKKKTMNFKSRNYTFKFSKTLTTVLKKK